MKTVWMPKVWSRFRERLHFSSGDLVTRQSFRRCTSSAEGPEFSPNIIFYMAIRPADFGLHSKALGKVELNVENGGWRRS